MRFMSGIVGFIGGVALTAVGACIWQHFSQSSTLSPNLDAPAILHEVRGLSQLTSVKYTMQKVVGLEEEKHPFGSEKILLFVQADVLAGIDLSHLTNDDVRNLPRGKVKIALPNAAIEDIVIDDKASKVWDRSLTWWTPWAPYSNDLERQARLKAREEIEKAAIEGGILNQARQNAETVVRRFLDAIGIKQIVFEPPSHTGV
jgi:Protein of unknown function (DUF4230)